MLSHVNNTKFWGGEQKPKEMTPLGKNWCRCEESITCDLKEIKGIVWTWLFWLLKGTSGTILGICHGKSGSIMGRIFLDYLKNYWLFKGSAPCSMLVNWVYMSMLGYDCIVNNFLQQQAFLNTVTVFHNFWRHKTDNTVWISLLTIWQLQLCPLFNCIFQEAALPHRRNK